MSGILGVWHFDGRTPDIGTFRTGLQRLTPAEAAPSWSWCEGPVALGYKSNSHTTSVHQRSHWKEDRAGVVACVFDGRLDNRDALLSTTRDAMLHANSPEADFVRAAYQDSGDDFIKRLRGDFVCAVFDPFAHRLIIARDRLGIRPLCFTQVDGTFLFSTEVKALLDWPAVNAAPDDVMIADFLLRFVAVDSQQRTFFRNIQSLPPSHLLVVTPERLSLRQYFDFDTRRPIKLGSVRDYADAFHQLVVGSVRNRLRGASRAAVSVSGGLDSAYIFATAVSLVRDGAAPSPVVVGYNYAGTAGSPSDEEVFVRAIEQTCHETIERIPQRAGFMEFAADEVWHSESPLLEALACQRQAMFRHMRDAGVNRLLTGHWGDQMLFDTDYMVDLWRSRQWSVLRRHMQRWGLSGRRLAVRIGRDLGGRYLPSSLTSMARRVRRRKDAPWRTGWYTKRFSELLRARFEARRLGRRPGSSHAWAIYQQSRRGYHVQCMEWNCRVAAMHGLDITFPYLDCDLVQFLMGIPGEIQSWDGVPRGLMREAMRGIVPDAVRERRTKGEFTQLANLSVEYDFPDISEILGPSSAAVQLGYVDGPALCSALAEWRGSIGSEPNSTLTNRVIDLCGLELLLRQFTARWQIGQRTHTHNRSAAELATL